jgi:hypothetical protein
MSLHSCAWGVDVNPRAVSKCLLCCWVLLAAEALAEEAAGPERPAQERSSGLSFVLGVRTGVGLPLGAVQGGDGEGPDQKLRSLVRGMVPLQLDVGILQSSRLYVGVYFQQALGLRAQSCPQGGSCLVTDLRAGLTASYSLPLSSTLNPWLGAGAGFELLQRGESSPRRGAEVFHVQGGADFHLSGPAWGGPFATFTFSKYLNVNEKKYHSWLIGGVRLQLRL